MDDYPLKRDAKDINEIPSSVSKRYILERLNNFFLAL
jgi:hypothetical protein